MNREEKRQLVCQLYKDGKTMREIAKEVHMSFGDIGKVTKKINQESEPEPKTKEKSKESQALELFKKGKNPVDVSITMDLNPAEVVQIYNQFWELKGLYQLLDLHKRFKGDTSLLLKVHEVIKKYNLTKKDIVNIVNWADEYIFLKEEVQELGGQFKDLLKQRHIANDSLLSTKKKQTELAGQIENYENLIKQKFVRIESMENEIEKLENQISLLREGDECYTKFEKIAREKLEVIMKERRWILALAIDVAIESMRENQFRQMIIDNTIKDQVNQDKLLGLCDTLFDEILKKLMDTQLESNAEQNIISG